MTAPFKQPLQSAERVRTTSFYEASARTRVELLLDAGSFVEFIGPELREVSAECGLRWGREMFFSRLHARLGIGGIIVELHREPAPLTPER